MDHVATIERAIARYADLAVSGDWDAWIGLFTEDAVFLPPGLPTIEGAEAIRKFVEDFPSLDRFEAKATQVIVSDGFAASRGRYAMSFATPDGQVEEAGKFIWIWEMQEDSSWRISQDIWNSDS